MLVRKMVVLTTSANVSPAASRMVLRFSSDCLACAAVSPSTSLPVAELRDLAGNEDEIAGLDRGRVGADRLRLRRRDGFLAHGPLSAGEMLRDLAAGLDQALHRLHRLQEHLPLGCVEVD